MGKKYFDTKAETLESSILGVWAEAAKKVAETNKNDKSDDGDGLDAVQPKAVKKKFKDRKDKDIDNDGDTDDSDEFLHKKRKAISKAMSKDEGNAFGKALKAAKEKGDKTFVVAGKTYEVYEEVELDEGPMDGFLRLTFKSPADVKKAMKVSDTEFGKGYFSMDKARTRPEVDFEGDRDGLQRLKDALKSAGIKFEIDLEEEVELDEVEESYEIGTNEYRDHTLEVTPGQTDPEWAKAVEFKIQSMKEALAKVWSLDEFITKDGVRRRVSEGDKRRSENNEKKDLTKVLKNGKTMTGKKSAQIDMKPKIKD